MSATLPRPGTLVTVRSSPPARTPPTDTGVWFVVGTADRGPLVPQQISSLQDFVTIYGARQSYSILYDALENYFREGGRTAWVQRVVGPAPVVATVNLLDGSAAVSLVAKAKGPGAYANTLRVTAQVPGAGATPASFSLLVTDTVLGTLEQSPDFTTQAQAVAWAQQSQWVALTIGASANIPVAVATAALTGGTDDRTNITDTQWANALLAFTRDFGPGQVSAPGRVTTTGHAQVLAHAFSANRFAVLDAPDSPTYATVNAAATAQRNTAPDDYCLGPFWPWVVIPGVLPGTTRLVPPCSSVAGAIARNDGAGNSPNRPAAGTPEGILQYAIGLSQVPMDNGSGQDITRDAMYSLGINQIVSRYGTFQIYGWRSLVDPNGAKQDWVNAGNGRLRMAIIALASVIAENYVLNEIDGNGRIFKALEGDLKGMLTPFYVAGSLYGTTPEQAFVVDTGPTVNTQATIAAREIHAAVGLRMSPNGELVVIEFAKVPVTQSL